MTARKRWSRAERLLFTWYAVWGLAIIATCSVIAGRPCPSGAVPKSTTTSTEEPMLTRQESSCIRFWKTGEIVCGEVLRRNALRQ